jgi:hypothetical protein
MSDARCRRFRGPTDAGAFRRAAALCLVLTALCGAGGGAGCLSYDAFHARFREPAYVVTPAFYREAPQRVAVLPFASPGKVDGPCERAEVCRKVFYQHMVLREFEDLELTAFERAVLGDDTAPARHPLLRRFLGVVRAVDVVGLTSVLDVQSIYARDGFEEKDVLEFLDRSRETLKADAVVLGNTRSYGRFYAVLISSIGISTGVQLRSTRTGALLWSSEDKDRNIQFPISLNPIDIPYLLYYTWANSRGVAMDMMAYRTYRDMVATVPFVPDPVEVQVRTVRSPTRLFAKPTMWRWRCVEKMPENTVMDLLLERNGWYKCRAGDGRRLWIFRSDAQLQVRPTGASAVP